MLAPLSVIFFLGEGFLSMSEQHQAHSDGEGVNLPGREVLSDPTPGLLSLMRKKAGLEGVQRMDIQQMADDDWLRLDSSRDGQLELKRLLMNSNPEHVCQVVPEGEAPAAELLHRIAEYLSDYHSSEFSFDGETLTEKASGVTHLISGVKGKEALFQIGKIVQEDFLIVTPTDTGTHRLVAGAVFFPSSWSLQKRIGQDLPTIHAEIPTLNENIGANIDRFLTHLKPDASWERSSFLLYNTDELALIPTLTSYVPDPKAIEHPEELFLRTERETFTRLPETGSVAFSFRTYIVPLVELPEENKLLLADILEAAPEEYVREYKGISDEALKVLLSFLRR